MKKIFKGCLIFLLIMFILGLIGCGVLYYSVTMPDDVEYLDKPLNISEHKLNLGDEHLKIPEIIMKQPKENVLYQIYDNSDKLLAVTTTLKIVFKIDENIILEHKFPINSKKLKEINNNIFSPLIKDITFVKPDINGFNPILALTDENQTINGTTSVMVYSINSNESMSFKTGSYSIHQNECTHGNVSDLLIYDKKNKLLYYERIWGGASSDLGTYCNKK